MRIENFSKKTKKQKKTNLKIKMPKKTCFKKTYMQKTTLILKTVRKKKNVSAKNTE